MTRTMAWRRRVLEHLRSLDREGFPRAADGCVSRGARPPDGADPRALPDFWCPEDLALRFGRDRAGRAVPLSRSLDRNSEHTAAVRLGCRSFIVGNQPHFRGCLDDSSSAQSFRRFHSRKRRHFRRISPLSRRIPAIRRSMSRASPSFPARSRATSRDHRTGRRRSRITRWRRAVASGRSRARMRRSM